MITKRYNQWLDYNGHLVRKTKRRTNLKDYYISVESYILDADFRLNQSNGLDHPKDVYIDDAPIPHEFDNED